MPARLNPYQRLVFAKVAALHVVRVLGIAELDYQYVLCLPSCFHKILKGFLVIVLFGGTYSASASTGPVFLFYI